MKLKDSVGEKHYRLVSEVLNLPKHFVASVRLGDKFYVVDDTQERRNTALKLDTLLKEYRNEGWHDIPYDQNYKPTMCIAVYERCG